jgi:4-hydroxy-tetrahydrodipicolinate synthase
MTGGRFGQLLTAMITPFTNSGEVDFEGAQSLAQILVQDGNDGLVICGTTGEAPTLSSEEKVALWKAVKQAVGSNVPVIAGTGSYCTRSTIALSQKAQQAGADGLLLVSPYYNKPSGKGMLEHFRAIHDATDLPIMLYNIPGRTGVEIPVEILEELAGLPRMAAVKQSLPIDPVSRLIARLGVEGRKNFDTYSGDDSQTLPQLAIGGVGVVSVAGHVAGKLIKEMIQAHAAGRVSESAAIHQRLFPLFEVLFITSNPVPVKVALKLMGRPAGPIRQPLWEATPEQEAAVAAVMREVGLLP